MFEREKSQMNIQYSVKTLQSCKRASPHTLANHRKSLIECFKSWLTGFAKQLIYQYLLEHYGCRTTWERIREFVENVPMQSIDLICSSFTWFDWSPGHWLVVRFFPNFIRNELTSFFFGFVALVDRFFCGFIHVNFFNWIFYAQQVSSIALSANSFGLFMQISIRSVFQRDSKLIIHSKQCSMDFDLQRTAEQQIESICKLFREKKRDTKHTRNCSKSVVRRDSFSLHIKQCSESDEIKM